MTNPRTLKHQTTVRFEDDNHIEFLAVSDKYVKPETLDLLFKNAVKQPMYYRHSTAVEGGTIFGRSANAEIRQMDDGYRGMFVKAETYNNNDLRRKALEYIRLNDLAGTPVGVSVGFQEYEDNDGNVYDAQLYDYSITPYPVVQESEITRTITMENAELQARIDELKTELDEKNNVNVTLEASVKDLTTSNKQLEDKLVSQKDTTADLQKQMDAMKDMFDAQTKQPFINELFEIEQDDELKEMYKGWDVKKLEDRLVKKRKTGVPITTKKLEQDTLETQEKITKSNDFVNKELEKVSTRYAHNPKLARALEKGLRRVREGENGERL